jgi:2-phosphoglycerate kinase
MIYLIGGAPRSGKTTIAKKLSMDLNVSWISVDTLEGLAQHFTPKHEYAKKFPKNIMRVETGNNNDNMYSKYSSSQITKAYIAQAKSSWEVINVLIEWLLGEHHSYIIEGHQIHPKLVAQLLKKHGNIKIKAVFLTRHTVSTIVASAKQGKDPNDWFITKTNQESTYPKIATMLSEYGNYLKAEAKKYKLKHYDMDNGFNKQKTKILADLKR